MLILPGCRCGALPATLPITLPLAMAITRCFALVLLLVACWPSPAAAGCLPDAQTLWIAPRSDGLVFATPQEACARADFTVWCGPPVGGGPLGVWSPYFCAYGCNPPEHCAFNPGWLRVRQAAHRCGVRERWDGEAQVCKPALTPDTGRPRCGLARGNPVHVGTGNKFEHERDFSHRNSPLLSVERYYNSQLGRWRFSFEQSLQRTWRWSDLAGYQETLVLERDDGRGLDCAREVSSGHFICAADRSLRIEAVAAAGNGAAWEVSTAQGRREWYAADGRLLRLRDAEGAELILDYDLAAASGGDDDDGTVDRLRDRWGNALTVVQTPDGVSAVITADGDRYEYLRREDGLLVAVRYPAPAGAEAAERRYLYEDPELPAALTGIIDERGERYATWAYDAAGRVVSSSRAGQAARHGFTYHPDGVTTVTEYVDDAGSEPIRAVTTYRLETVDGATRLAGIDGDLCADCGVRREVAYDINGFPARVIGPDGTVTTFRFDGEGHELERLEAAGTGVARRTVTTWNLALRRRVSRDVYDMAEPHPRHVHRTTFAYLDQRLVSISEHDPETGAERTTGYAWFADDDPRAQGRLREVRGPRAGAVERFEYDGNGNPAAYINALGHRREYENHDAAGRPGLLRDANGVETTMDWHPRAGLLRTATGAAEIRYTRDAAGRVSAVTNPLGGTTHYRYDRAGRLVGIESPAGEAMTLVLNGRGQTRQLKLSASDGAVHYTRDFIYDENGRLQRILGGAGQSWDYDYDAAGRLAALVDPRRDGADQSLFVAALRYDAHGRLVEQTLPGGGAVQLAWDPLHRLASVTDGRGLSTRYQYDALGTLQRLDSPDSGSTRFNYDAAGALASQLDGRGRLQHYRRDGLGRLTMLDATFDAPRDYRYDEAAAGCHGVGRLTAAGDHNGTLRLCYDDAGRVTTLAPAGLPADRPVTYQRDAAGLVRVMTYPSGLEVHYRRDSSGRPIDLALRLPANSGEDGAQPPATPLSLVSDIRYAPFGPAMRWRLHYAAGVQREAGIELDQDYRITASINGDVGALSYAYDAAGNLVSRGSGTDLEHVTVDAASRLRGVAQPGGFSTAFAYDANGNRVLKERSAGGYLRRTSYGIAAGSNRVLYESAGFAGVAALEYDAGGNRIRHYDPVSGAQREYGYSDRNELVASRLSVGPLALDTAATYNVLGQRIALQIRYAPPFDAYDRSKRFAYDARGRLLGEQLQGRWRYDYIYLDDMPIAFVFYPESGPARAFHYHVDSLGTPRAATAFADGSLAWSLRPAAGDPFRLVATSVDGIAPGLRFPGQYSDPETGTVYNNFRDYDAYRGRYLQSDPIGLQGGLNTYSYALNNPLRYADPLGLAVRFVCRALSSPLALGREHCFVRLTCPEEGWTETLSLFGRYMPGDGLFPSRGSKVRASVTSVNTDNASFMPPTFDEVIAPETCPTSSCEFEKAVLRRFENFPSGLVEYGVFGPNSNSFARDLATGTRFGGQLPPGAPGPLRAPGIGQPHPGFR